MFQLNNLYTKLKKLHRQGKMFQLDNSDTHLQNRWNMFHEHNSYTNLQNHWTFVQLDNLNTKLKNFWTFVQLDNYVYRFRQNNTFQLDTANRHRFAGKLLWNNTSILLR